MGEFKDEFIISFGECGLGALSQGWHRILSLLARKHRVLHVAQHYYLRTGKPALCERRRNSGLRMIEPNLYEYQPPWYLPKNYRYPWWNQAVDTLTVSTIRRIARELGCEKPILYFWHPRYVRMLKRFDEKLVCYHICDDYFDPRWNEPPELHEMDRRLLGGSDLVFAMSPSLVRKARQSTDQTYLIPNGVDYEFFESASSQRIEDPSDVAGIPHPRIGYTGCINAKMDFELLAFLAERRPEWSFLLIGPIRATEAQTKRCRGLKNIHFLGGRDYSQIPEYVAALDVCVIPNVVEGWVRSTYPQKLHEYFAAGKPVVSADIEAVRDFEPIARIAQSPEEWLREIERALASSDPEEITRRKEIAVENTWEQRVFQIESLMKKALSSEAPQPVG